MKLLPQPEALRQTRFGWPDLLVILTVLIVLGLLAHAGSEAMTVLILLVNQLFWWPLVAWSDRFRLKQSGFAEVGDGDVGLTPVGQDFATTTILRSKDLFRQKALERVPVISSIVHTLQQKADGSLRSDFFLDIWDDDFPSEEAERQLATAVDWGRYGELFEYDAGEGRLTLPR